MVSEEVKASSKYVEFFEVLILVIAVDGLGVEGKLPRRGRRPLVLILVIAVDGLGESSACSTSTNSWSLNPCYSGRWSRS